MADLPRKLGAFAAALVFVCGVIAIAAFLLKLGGGDVSARGAIAMVLGVAAVVLIPRYVHVSELLGGYSALVYLFLFAPILVVIIYAFNSGNNVASFESISTVHFSRALDDASFGTRWTA